MKQADKQIISQGCCFFIFFCNLKRQQTSIEQSQLKFHTANQQCLATHCRQNSRSFCTWLNKLTQNLKNQKTLKPTVVFLLCYMCNMLLFSLKKCSFFQLNTVLTQIDLVFQAGINLLSLLPAMKKNRHNFVSFCKRKMQIMGGIKA